MAVSAVDEDIIIIQQGQQLFDHVVYGLSCLYHHKHLTRALQLAGKLLQRMAADDVLSGSTTGNKPIGFLRCTVIYSHSESLGFHVHHKVLAHDGQADQSDICFLHYFSSYRCTRALPAYTSHTCFSSAGSA